MKNNNDMILRDLVKQLGIMSLPGDFDTVSRMLTFNNSTKILELGGGAASWSIGITKMLNNSPHITVVENFEFLNYSGDTWWYDWPTCESELKQSIEETCERLGCSHNIQVLDIDAKLLPEKLKHQTFDVIRLDCFEHAAEIKNILRWAYSSLTNDGLLCIDDIQPSITINRFMCTMDLVREKLIKPVWIGSKEAVFCKWESDKNFIPKDMQYKLLKVDNLEVDCRDGYEAISYWRGFE